MFRIFYPEKLGQGFHTLDKLVHCFFPSNYLVKYYSDFLVLLWSGNHQTKNTYGWVYWSGCFCIEEDETGVTFLTTSPYARMCICVLWGRGGCWWSGSHGYVCICVLGGEGGVWGQLGTWVTWLTSLCVRGWPVWRGCVCGACVFWEQVCHRWPVILSVAIWGGEVVTCISDVCEHVWMCFFF